MALRTRLSNLLSKIVSKAKKIPALLRDPKRRWWVIGSGVVLLAAIGGLVYYRAVYLPSQQTGQATLQTALARRGDIILSAGGSGTLQAANQVQLGFGTSGKLTKLNVKIGDQVKAGDLLAALDNTSQQIQLLQAKRALADLTSATSIATAQQDLATANADVYSTKNQLIYLISPRVFYDEQQIADAQQALDQAQAEAGSPPTSDQQKKIDAANSKLKSAQAALSGDMIWYAKNYVPNNFTVIQRNAITHQATKTIQAPTDADIAAAHAAYAAALASVQEAQWYLDALSGVTIPDTATGANLSALEQAKLNLQSAQDTLDATQLHAPFPGIVTTVDAQLGDSVGSSAIITVADTSTLYVQTYIDESDYAMFKVGNRANVVFDALPSQTFTGKVVEVDPALVTSSGSSAVRGLVQLNPTTADLLIGMNATVTIVGGQAQNAVIIPQTALHEYAPGQYAVFVMRNGKLAVTYVEVGLEDQVNAEILSGLQPGDVISTGLSGTKTQ